MKSTTILPAIGILFFLASASMHAQQERILTPQEMEQDITFYFKQLRKLHPNLYQHYTSAQYDSLQKETINKCTVSLSIQNFTRILLALNRYTDGHTQILTNHIWPKPVKNYYFPYFTLRNTWAIIGKDQVISVNGIPVANIIQEIQQICSTENNPKLNESNINFYFPLYLSTFYSVAPPYYITLKDIPTGKIHSDTIPAKNLWHTAPIPFQFKFFPDEAIAILFYNSCNLSRNLMNEFNKALNIGFQQMQKQNIKYLFIDVRNNGGGNADNNELIFRHLKSSKYKGTYKVKYNMHLIDSIVKHDVRANRIFLKQNGTNFWKTFLIKRKIRKIEKQIPQALATGIEFRKEKYPSRKKGFEGNVFILQSRETYSAAISLCESVRQRKIGIIVGEEGGQPIIYSGNIEIYHLPNSRISFSIATTYNWYEPTIPTKNGFLQPDIEYDVYNKDLKIEDYKKIIQLSNTLKRQ